MAFFVDLTIKYPEFLDKRQNKKYTIIYTFHFL